MNRPAAPRLPHSVLLTAALSLALLCACGTQAGTPAGTTPAPAPAPAAWCGGLSAQRLGQPSAAEDSGKLRTFTSELRNTPVTPGVPGDHPLTLTGLAVPPANTLYSSVQAGWALSRWEQAASKLLPGCPAPVIAVIEGGFQDLPELAANLTPQASWLDLHALRQAGGDPAMNEQDRLTIDRHGRATAGVIADPTDTGDGLPGYGYNLLQVLPISIPLRSTPLARAIEYAALGRTVIGDQVFVSPTPAQVITVSLATTVVDAAVQSALKQARNAGVVVLAASGNTGTTGVQYPASDPNVLAVGAYEDAGGTTTYTSTGPELFALRYGRTFSRQASGALTTENGTSFASPFVAAQVGLWLYSNAHFSGSMFAGYAGGDHLNFALRCLTSAGEATTGPSRGVGVIDASRLVSPGNLACR